MRSDIPYLVRPWVSNVEKDRLLTGLFHMAIWIHPIIMDWPCMDN